MRRLVVGLLMFFVPFQFAWAAAQSLHGHVSGDVPTLGFHQHAGDHGHHDDFEGDSGGAGNADGHAHHVIMVFAVFDADLKICQALPSGRPFGTSVRFTSRIPPPFDWPPSARC